MTERFNRRNFLEMLTVCSLAPLLPPKYDFDIRKHAEKYATFVQESGLFEPDRIYPVLHNFAGLPSEYSLPIGNVSCVTENDLVKLFAEIIVTTDMNLFSSPAIDSFSPYAVAHQVNLDPKLYGGEIHTGVDMVSGDPHKNNTIFLNPIRSRMLGRIDIARLSTQVPIMQVLTAQDNDLQIKVAGKICDVFMLYGHLLPVKTAINCGDIVEVGTPLGDITKNMKVGASSGPHVHAEMIAIPTDRNCTLAEALLHEEYDPKVENLYFDTNFLWKFLPGDLKFKTGIRPEVWNVTKSAINKKQFLGEK